MPDKCEPGYYEPIASGKIIVENGEEIYGAIRISRSDIRSFDQVGSVGNAEGSRVFELHDGRHFILIDRFNSLNYVIGYEVVPCRKKCYPCPTSCTRKIQNTIYYAHPTRTSESDIVITMGRKVVKCVPGATVPRVDCTV